jgi:hypothetical protein
VIRRLVRQAVLRYKAGKELYKKSISETAVEVLGQERRKRNETGMMTSVLA